MSARQAAARSRPPRAAEPEPRNTHQAGRRATRLCLRSGAGAAPSARPGCSLAGSARRTARKNSIAAFSMYVGPVSFKPCRCAQWPPRRVVASTVAGLPRHSAVGRPLHAQGAQSSAHPLQTLHAANSSRLACACADTFCAPLGYSLRLPAQADAGVSRRQIAHVMQARGTLPAQAQCAL